MQETILVKLFSDIISISLDSLTFENTGTIMEMNRRVKLEDIEYREYACGDWIVAEL